MAKFFDVLLTDVERVKGNKIKGTELYLFLLTNMSIQAQLLIRLAINSSRYTYVIYRWILISRFSIDVSRGAVIGSGLFLPHPMNIVIGRGVVLSSRVTLYHGVTLGNKNGYPKVESDVTIFPNSVIVGKITIGKNVTIGANSFLDKGVPDNHVHYAK